MAALPIHAYDGLHITRPRMTYDLLNYVFRYHNEDDFNQWAIAFDIGCGHGEISKILATRFEFVIATNPTVSVPSQRLAAVIARLEPNFHEKIRFIQGKAQNVCELAEEVDADGDTRPGRVDVAILSDELWFMHPEAAMNNIWELLRPAGTMAIILYGRPKFVCQVFTPPARSGSERRHPPIYRSLRQLLDPIDRIRNAAAAQSNDEADFGRDEEISEQTRILARSIQRLFNALLTRVCFLIGAADPEHPVNITAKNRFNNVSIDTQKWDDIRRYQWLTNDPFLFFSEQPGNEVPIISNVDEDEIYSTIESPATETPLQAEWTLEHVSEFLKRLVPPERSAAISGDQILSNWFLQLTDIMHGRWLIKYPCALIVAKKNITISDGPTNEIMSQSRHEIVDDWLDNMSLSSSDGLLGGEYEDIDSEPLDESGNIRWG